MMISFTFKKSERLCSRKIIGEIFLSGKWFICYPLKVVWINAPLIDTSYSAQAAFSVPKKNFKKAHDRNLAKRKMRESYRYLKNTLYDYLEKNGQKIALVIVFIGQEDMSFSQINTAMKKALERLERENMAGK